MGFVITIIGVLAAAGAAVWLPPLRARVLGVLSQWNRFTFTCQVAILADEACDQQDRDRLQVQMQGRIVTPCDDYDTTLRLEIDDITDSLFKPEQVLSVNPEYHGNDGALFRYQAHNGRIPKRNAILSHWVTAASIPFSSLRFAYRGRRKLLCRLSVLSAETGEVLVSDQQVIHYISCREGYRQIQQHKLAVLTASIQLALKTVCPDGSEPAHRSLIADWLGSLCSHFSAASELIDSLKAIELQCEPLPLEAAAEPLLAFGEARDRTAALSLAIKLLVVSDLISAIHGQNLVSLAQLLDIKPDHFTARCQEILLEHDCRIEDPSFLLGVDTAMEPGVFRHRLNDMYRRWNGRVTHPDKRIRQQADRILSLIAELRSRQHTHA